MDVLLQLTSDFLFNSSVSVVLFIASVVALLND